MPFDPNPDRVVILPPSPPERGEPRRQRVHIEIEIVDRRQQSPPRRGYRFGTFTLVLFVLLLLAALAHAQPSDGRFHYEHWQGPDGWHGETRSQGSTTDWDSYGPNGQARHCHRYFAGDTPYTNCR
jgi:hypothetical protein